jgi:transcriptional regulator of arginine metabolism
MSTRDQRQAAILRLVQERTVRSQNELKALLAEEGISVGQGTLSRDIRDLRLVKRTRPDGHAAYGVPADPAPALQRLLPALYLSAEGVDHFLVIHTLTGGAQPLAVAIDREDWDDVLGTIAGDDTILLIVRDTAALAAVQDRLETLARNG